MIICFACQAETKRQLDQLVKAGEYDDYGEAISAAVANQVLLTQAVNSGGPLVLPLANLRRDDAGYGRQALRTKRLQSERVAGPKPRDPRIPLLFSLDGLVPLSYEPAEPPPDPWGRVEAVPINRWLFGQHNRFLPVKASCRALAHLLEKAPAGVVLSEAAATIATDAAELGDFLSERDAKLGLKRDAAAAIAFPHSGPGLTKGRLRYASQFVGGVSTDGQLTGMLADLGLICRIGFKGDVRVSLTAPGSALAALMNPILDKPSLEPGLKLSPQETALLLQHISHSVRAEDYAYRVVLAGIDAGANTPDDLDETLASRVNEGKEPQISQAFLSTQRAGVVSRMVDLGLVLRVRDGLTVTYVVTASGKQYIKRDQHQAEAPASRPSS